MWGPGRLLPICPICPYIYVFCKFYKGKKQQQPYLAKPFLHSNSSCNACPWIVATGDELREIVEGWGHRPWGSESPSLCRIHKDRNVSSDNIIGSVSFWNWYSRPMLTQMVRPITFLHSMDALRFSRVLPGPWWTTWDQIICKRRDGVKTH